MTTFRSVLSVTIGSYLTLKRALGRQYAAEEWVLAHLDRFLAARHADLVAETFAAWCLTLQHLATGTRRAACGSCETCVCIDAAANQAASSPTRGCFRRSTRPSGHIYSPTAR